ncbi:hypothetical protein ACHAWC_007842 [Mediolabrus comicus]
MSSSWESMDLSERYHHRYDSPPTSPPMAYNRHHSEDSNMSISPLLDRPDLPDTYAQLAQSIENGHNPPSALETPTLSHAASAAASDPSEEPLDGGESTPSSPSAEENNEQPQQLVRRTSMSDVEQAQRRASIKHIMADPSLSQLEKRRSIQQLMDGRQNGGRRSTIDSGMMNPYMAARQEQAQRLRSIRRSSSFDDGDSTDERPITANTRHFSYTATAATANSSINNSSIHASSSSNSLINNNSIHNSNHHHPAESSFDSSSSFPYQQQKQHSSHDDQNISPSSIPTTTVGADEASASFPHHNSINRRAIEMAPPCTHYSRNCHIVSPCCGATFGCRICHDDCPVLPPLLEQGTPSQVGEAAEEAVAGTVSLEDGNNDVGKSNNTNTGTTPTGRRKYQRVLRTSSMPTSFTQESPPEHHNVDRFAIREIMCRKCYTKQSSKTNNCINCGIQFGQYHCDICNLWMSNEERPYHCPDCGFCRVGGGENFQHCQDCGMCIDKQLFQDHNCKVGKYMSNCPVCQEDLFSSRDASHELPCGHAIHWHCFRELASHDSRCPMCKKTAETPERMKPTWDAMAMGIAMQPVPPELSKVVTIKCNDCEIVQENRSWHFLGVRCNQCESFNTVVERITMMGQDAHEFLLRSGEQSTATTEVSAAINNARGGGQQQQQQGVTGSTRRPARRRRATVDSAVAPSVSAPWSNHRDNENHPDR